MSQVSTAASELLLCLLLGWASASDLRRRTIPNACTLAGSGAFAVLALTGGPDWPVKLASGFVAFGTLATIALARPGSLGMGDAKLAGVISLALGPLAVAALSAGFLSALVSVAPAMARCRWQGVGELTVAMAPHLSLGAVFVVALVE